MNGILYGVGVGPGDPELLTLKAIRLMLACDVIAVPQKPDRCTALSIAAQAAPEILKKPILTVELPMTHDAALRERAYEEGADRLIEQLSKGKTVAFLTLGDPTVYSTYGYLRERVASRGFDARFVPGVPSFCAAAAALGEPLCSDRESLHIIPGEANAEDALALSGTKVFMKGALPDRKAAILSHGVKASAVEQCGMPQERIYRDVNALPDDAGYYTVLIAKE